MVLNQPFMLPNNWVARYITPKLKTSLMVLMAAMVLMAMMTMPAFATANTDLLASSKAKVGATFGGKSTMVSFFLLAEVIMTVFIYIKTRNPMVLIGGILLAIVVGVLFAMVGF